MTVFNLAFVQRRLFLHFADRWGLYRVPPLADHFELGLLAVVLARCTHMISADFMLACLLILLPSHVLRGLRWQFSLLYITFAVYLRYGLQDTLFLVLPLLATLFICLMIPVVPPIIHSNPVQCVGVQDICLESESGKRFWSKFYYPCRYRYSTSWLALAANLSPYVVILLLSHRGLLDELRVSVHHGIVFLSIMAVHTVVAVIDIHLGLGVSNYFPDVRYAYGLARYQAMPGVIFSHLRLLKSHCFEDAEVDSPNSLQVVLFFHGLSGSGSTYSQTCMELASKGYLVIAPEFSDGSAAYTSLPNGEEIYYRFHGTYAEHSPEWYASYQSQLAERAHQVNAIMSYLVHANKGSVAAYYSATLRWRQNKRSCFLDSIRNKISSEKPILIGHSFGGATCVFLSSMNHEAAVRFRKEYSHKAILLYDPWLQPLAAEVRNKAFPSLSIPILCLQAELWIESGNEEELDRKVLAAAPIWYQIKVKGAGHTNYSDGGMFAPIISRRLRATGSIDPTLVLRDVTCITVEFLKTHANSVDIALQNINGNESDVIFREQFIASIEKFKYLLQIVRSSDSETEEDDDCTTEEA